MDGSKFRDQFLKGSPKEHFCEIISKSDRRFQRRRFFKNIFMSVLCKKPPFTRATFMDGSKFREQILKSVTQGTFLCNYFKIGPVVLEEIFTELLKKFHFVAMATRDFDGIKFCEQFLKRTPPPPPEHSCRIWSKLAKQFGRRCLKKLLTTHHGRRATDTGPS